MDAGKFLLSLSLRGGGQDICTDHLSHEQSRTRNRDSKEWKSSRVMYPDILSYGAPSRKIHAGTMKAIAGHLEKLFNRNDDNRRSDVSSGQSSTLSDYEDYIEDSQSCCSFEEAMAMMLSVVSNTKAQFNPEYYDEGHVGGGARQGLSLKENFDQFASSLAQNVKTLDSTNVVDKDHMLEASKMEHQSDWELATAYFWNFPVVSAALVILYAFVQILLRNFMI
ncbi:hypothetical protein RHMOL_Rhmol08G0243500 [Rhododendron molle]|uniref:Uncharacterized protein n=1 Tax=Rhododendron molle TaxID=49168 RepID=A0ACC0MS97_RHOML|nr:hypothetical protein RHMOL_Rhmol08G0243500 [Rhododendron molle]